MTKNGLRVNCYCLAYACAGKEMGWRARDDHARKDAANRPLYPVVEDQSNGQDQVYPDEGGEPAPLNPPPSYYDVPMDDIVSHVETLPNVNEPLFNTVWRSMCPLSAMLN
jgi:hypothetical protein